MTRAQSRPRRRILDAVKRKGAPHTCKVGIVFLELDKRQDTGFTVSLEWNRDTGEAQIVVDREPLRLAGPRP